MAEVVADPETDPNATYAVDPARVRALTARVVAAGDGGEELTRTPMTGCTAGGAAAVDRPRRRVSRSTRPAAPSAGGPSPPSRSAPRCCCGCTTSCSTGSPSCSTWCSSRSGKARSHAYEEVADCAIVARHYARRGPDLLRETKHVGVLPVLSRARRVSPAQGRRRHRVAVELPAQPGGHRRHPGDPGRQRRRAAPGPAGSADRVAAADLRGGRAARAPRCSSSWAPASPPGRAVVDSADYIGFTGSTATGRRVVAGAPASPSSASASSSAARTPCTSRRRRPPAGRPRRRRATFTSAGQLCISAERIVVHAAVYDEFVADASSSRSRRMRLSTGLHWGADMGSLVSAEQKEKVARAHRRRRLQGRQRAHRWSGPPRPRPVLLRADRAQRRHRGDELPSTRRPSGRRLGLPVASDDEAVRDGQRHRVRPQRLVSWTRDVAADGRSPPGSTRAR